MNLLTEETFQAHAAAMKLVLDGRLSGACHGTDASSVACTLPCQHYCDVDHESVALAVFE